MLLTLGTGSETAVEEHIKLGPESFKFQSHPVTRQQAGVGKLSNLRTPGFPQMETLLSFMLELYFVLNTPLPYSLP